MSQSNDSAAAKTDTPTMEEKRPEPLAFTLQVVSPSVGVSRPLSFPRLSATTTIKQLKAKIRDALPSEPRDDCQRLIHRGRMLARETETMLEVFGQEEVPCNPDRSVVPRLIAMTFSFHILNLRHYILSCVLLAQIYHLHLNLP